MNASPITELDKEQRQDTYILILPMNMFLMNLHKNDKAIRKIICFNLGNLSWHVTFNVFNYIYVNSGSIQNGLQT